MGQEIQTSHTRALLVAQEIQTNLPKALGWKEVVSEEKEAFILVEAPRVISSEEGVEILVPDSLVDSVSSNLKLCLIGRFFFFRPSIEMIRKWVS